MDKEKAFKKIRSDFEVAIRAYFQAETSSQGADDADTVVQIFDQHWKLLEIFDTIGDLPPEEDTASVVDLEDGLHMAEGIGSFFNSGMLATLEDDSQKEILFACIYALNSKISRLENEWRAKWYEQRNRNKPGG
jgi:hypothetical protein